MSYTVRSAVKYNLNGMRRRNRGVSRSFALAIALLLMASLIIFLVLRGDPLLRTGTGSVANSLCSAAFVSGLAPSQVYREEQLHIPGIDKLSWALRYAVDRDRKEVRATILGGFGARAIYREGFGCHLARGDAPSPLDSIHVLPIEPATSGNLPPLEIALEPRLAPALEAAFAEVDVRGLRQTKAIVVLKDGKLIAERYAPGYTAETPIWSHSLTKSVTNALIGILVREGKLKVAQPAPIAAWQTPGDPRHAVTIDQLLRMDSGLPPDETNDLITFATRMWMLEPDSVAFAARQALVSTPGTQWAYSNLGYALLSGVIREVAGGGSPGRTLSFIRRELFEPLGMEHATLEFDAAGNPEGNGFMVASARDWARFGHFFLDDGVVSGRRLLPEGWTKYSATPTLDTGYGAGFWTNRKQDGEVPYWGIAWGLPSLPADTYFGRGALGQFLVIVPSERLVVVRLGLSHGTSTGIDQLGASILAILRAKAG